MFSFGKKNDSGEAEEPTPQGRPAPEAAPGDVRPLEAEERLKAEAKRLNLVGNAQLGAAIAEAVRRGLEEHFVFEEAQLRAVVTTIGRTLLTRLREQSRAVRGLPKQAFLREVEEDKRKIEAQRERARKELDALLSQLESRHSELGRMEENLVREAQEHAKVEDRAIAEHISMLFAGCQTPEDYEKIREQITKLTLGSLADERERSIEAQLAEYKRDVENYQRRISKLTNSLELTEEELKRVAAAKNIEIGVQSIYRTVQGLAGDDTNFETKKELMSSIFQANLELQKGRVAN
ncbi:MAG: hypothetical protein H6828_01705 [Planctomycetes bacterium]|nr:hypothetical protein [Planctomycetota bacterium]